MNPFQIVAAQLEHLELLEARKGALGNGFDLVVAQIEIYEVRLAREA